MLGVGLDERTAMVIDETGRGVVWGRGAVYVVDADHAPAVCAANTPLTFEGLGLYRLTAGDTYEFASGAASVPRAALGVRGGRLDPTNPY